MDVGLLHGFLLLLCLGFLLWHLCCCRFSYLFEFLLLKVKIYQMLSKSVENIIIFSFLYELLLDVGSVENFPIHISQRVVA